MNFENFLKLMDKLLGENGCPWDREQTHESLRQYLLEECYETIEAINTKDMTSLREELGDVLLQVVFHAKLAENAGAFTIDDVISEVSHKLVSRHTHVFGADKAVSAEDVVLVWEANKQKERKHSPMQAMNAVPKALPALVRASKVLKRASISARHEIIEAIKTSLSQLEDTNEKQFELYGNILLDLVKLSAILEINAELSLTNAVEGFINSISAESPAQAGDSIQKEDM